MRIAVLTSSSAAGIDHLLAAPDRGVVFDLAVVLTSETSLAQREKIERANVPVVARPIREYHAERGLPFHNLNSRTDYDEETTEILRRFQIDYVILAGYEHVITEPLLDAFPQRVIALHDGDLSLKDEYGRRRFSGPDAVRDAILAGEEVTRCSAYIVTRSVGEGPLLLISGAWPVAALARAARLRGDIDTLCSYADLHKAWVRQEAWGEMMLNLCEILAAGRLQISGDVVFVDGAPGPCRFGHSPAMCHEPHSPIDPGIPASCPFFTK